MNLKNLVSAAVCVLIAALTFTGCADGVSGGGTPGKTYKVGDTGPAGGIIFYVNPNAARDGWTYLEAAPSNMTGGEFGMFQMDIERGSDIANLISIPTKAGIGSGKANTQKIFDVLGSDTEAVTAVKAYNFGGKNDWFIPSKDELKELYKIKDDVGNFISDYYYTST